MTNLNNLLGKNYIDLTIKAENQFVVTKVDVEADLVWASPINQYKNTQSPKLFEGKLFNRLVRKGRIILN